MNARRTLAALAASSALAGTTLVAAPAHADTLLTHDAARDVVGGDVDGPDNPTDVLPGRAEGDALTMRVQHGARQVRVTVQYAALTRLPRADVIHLLALRTSAGRTAELNVYVSGGHWQGRRLFYVDGQDRHCRGLSSRVDYDAATVTYVVPRRCLGDPRWVRAGAGTGVLSGHRLFADDVSLDSRLGDELTLGPVVRR